MVNRSTTFNFVQPQDHSLTHEFMNILLIGSGGREHALAWKLAQSPSCDRLFIAPGNAGTAKLGTNVAIGATDLPALASLCISEKIDMVVVGPEDPLVKGIYDFFKADATTTHIHVIGPSRQAARLEGSKAYAKAFMQRYGIPTAGYRDFDAFSFEEGSNTSKSNPCPSFLRRMAWRRAKEW
jgi:phosphoribosylamine--glycine ligase